MPSPSEILEGLTHIANNWIGIAVAWHIAIAGLLAALIVGWRPTQRLLRLLLALPLVSVSVFAWLTQNPFNGVLFALGAVALSAVGARLPRVPVQRASNPAVLIGLATVAFGWVYPHFLEGVQRSVTCTPHPLVSFRVQPCLLSWALRFSPVAWDRVLGRSC